MATISNTPSNLKANWQQHLKQSQPWKIVKNAEHPDDKQTRQWLDPGGWFTDYTQYDNQNSGTPPPPPPPPKMPTSDDEQAQVARRKSVQDQYSRRGRASTILTDSDNEKLGG